MLSVHGASPVMRSENLADVTAQRVSSGINSQGKASRMQHGADALKLDVGDDASSVKIELAAKDSFSCAKAPMCLEPSQACLSSSDVARSKRAECAKYPKFCGRSIYKLPTTGLKITLPPMPIPDLVSLYEQAYNGQAKLNGPTDWRPTQQAQMVLKQASLQHKTGLTVVEMGCAAGYVLYNVRQLASNGGKLICFEPDADFTKTVAKTFDLAKSSTTGLSTEHKRQFFDGDQLEPASVDVFMSSQAVEHLVDPCPWLSALQRVLKPGGLVFTEVPNEYDDPDKNVTRGLFHMMWFNEQVWAKIMLQAGFEEVELTTVKPPTTKWGMAVRSIFRKPLQ